MSSLSGQKLAQRALDFAQIALVSDGNIDCNAPQTDCGSVLHALQMRTHIVLAGLRHCIEPLVIAAALSGIARRVLPRSRLIAGEIGQKLQWSGERAKKTQCRIDRARDLKTARKKALIAEKFRSSGPLFRARLSFPPWSRLWSGFQSTSPGHSSRI
jgi:hypothetical protein